MDEIMTRDTAEKAAPETKKRWKKPTLSGKKRRWPKVLLTLAVLAALIVGVVLPRLRGGEPQPTAGYTVETAQRRDLAVRVTGTATLEPADSYHKSLLCSIQ